MGELNINNYPQVKQESCVMHHKCGNCLKICRDRAISAMPCYSDSVCSSTFDRLESKKTAFIEQEFCSRCGLCYQVCPTSAIEDVNAVNYMSKAFALAKQGTAIIFVCEHADFKSELRTLSLRAEGEAIPVNEIASGLKPLAMTNSELILVPDISIISWRSILKILSMGSAITLIGCDECRQTEHFKQIEEMFADSCYEGAFRFFERGEENPPVSPFDKGGLQMVSLFEKGGQGGFKEVSLNENILEQIITSYTGKIPFPGTAWIDIGDRCTLCQNCANVCPTGALSVRKMGAKLALMYDHNLCKGCPVCEKACPERCITIDRRLRLNKLSAIDVKCESNMLFCKGCDKPIAADAAFERVKNILAAHGQKTEQLAYCPDCKGSQLFGMTI